MIEKFGGTWTRMEDIRSFEKNNWHCWMLDDWGSWRSMPWTRLEEETMSL